MNVRNSEQKGLKGITGSPMCTEFTNINTRSEIELPKFGGLSATNLENLSLCRKRRSPSIEDLSGKSQRENALKNLPILPKTYEAINVGINIGTVSAALFTPSS
jgi:hypothetical protein